MCSIIKYIIFLGIQPVILCAPWGDTISTTKLLPQYMKSDTTIHEKHLLYDDRSRSLDETK